MSYFIYPLSCCRKCCNYRKEIIVGGFDVASQIVCIIVSKKSGFVNRTSALHTCFDI